MKLGELINQYRTERGLSQRQFANLSGLSNGYISMLERGFNPNTGKPIAPTFPQLQKLAQSMGMTIPELIAAADVFDIVDFDTASLLLTEDMNALESEYGYYAPHIKRIQQSLIKLNEKGLITAAEYIEYLASKTEYQYGE